MLLYRITLKFVIMKKTGSIIAAACAAFMFIGTAASAQNTRLKPSQTVLLYPEGQQKSIDGTDAGHVGIGAVEVNGLTGNESIDKYGNMSNTSDSARFDLYFPKKPNGQMIIVCPGGGYKFTSTHNEGVYVAEWLINRGITVAVVKYRMPNGHWTIPLTDVQNTFRYCREHAAAWGVDQIGVMGFSAGGHLAASASTLFTDEVTRPDFSILVYPVITMDKSLTHKGTRTNLIGKDEKWTGRNKLVDEYEASMKQFRELEERYSLEKQITENTPRTYIVLSQDDTTVPAMNSIMYYTALTEHKVPAEIHIFPSGGHGWGFSSEKYAGKGKDAFAYARDDFEQSLERWLVDVHGEVEK